MTIRTLRLLAVLGASLAVASVHGYAQQGQPQHPTPNPRPAQPPAVQSDRNAPHFVAADVLLRAPAVLAESRGEETAARVQVGDVRDLLIETSTGRVRLVGVSCEGNVHALPARDARWDPAERCWVLGCTKEQLMAAKIAVGGDLRVLRVPARSDGDAGVAAAEAGAWRDATTMPLSHLMTTPIEGAKGEVAQSSVPVVETRSGTLAFLSFTCNARPVAAPFGVVAVHSEAREDAAPKVTIRLPADRPANGELPQVAGPGALEQETNRAAVYQAFGVERPAYDPAPAPRSGEASEPRRR
ncbi:MAG: hypothetical protein IPM29_06895 [Planctomycetes bacterium]|nr:hypothetical protein [Planctomycetota bacterium]